MSDEEYAEFDSSAYAYGDNSAYAIYDEHASYTYAVEELSQAGAEFGYTQQDYSGKDEDMEQASKIKVSPENLAPHPESSISSVPKLNIGPEFKPTKGAPQKTSNTINIVPYPDGYTPKGRALNPTKNIISVPTPASYYPPSKTGKASKKMAIRAAGGTVWEDKSMMNWDVNDYRLFAGNMGNEVTTELLRQSFRQYPSLLQTHVVRDKRTGKSKGYGFISFSDDKDFVKAMREMNGKYIGNRPVLLRKSTWKDRVADEETIKYQKELGDVAKSVTKIAEEP